MVAGSDFQVDVRVLVGVAVDSVAVRMERDLIADEGVRNEYLSRLRMGTEVVQYGETVTWRIGD
jgi:hypothetical protein